MNQVQVINVKVRSNNNPVFIIAIDPSTQVAAAIIFMLTTPPILIRDLTKPSLSLFWWNAATCLWRWLVIRAFIRQSVANNTILIITMIGNRRRFHWIYMYHNVQTTTRGGAIWYWWDMQSSRALQTNSIHTSKFGGWCGGGCPRCRSISIDKWLGFGLGTGQWQRPFSTHGLSTIDTNNPTLWTINSWRSVTVSCTM